MNYRGTWWSNVISGLQQTWPSVHRGLILQLPPCTGRLPCSSGPAAAGLRGSCWRWLHSERLRWSVWQQLQPAWLQPAEESDTGQPRMVPENSYTTPFHCGSGHCLFEATTDRSQPCHPLLSSLLPALCKRWACSFAGLILVTTDVTSEHNGLVLARRHYFTASLPNPWHFYLSTLMSPTPCK